MLKEIFEQPESLRNAMRGRLCRDEATAVFGGLNLTPQQLALDQPHRAHRLRHELARGAGRRISDRGIRADSGRSRIRQRAALSQPADGSTTRCCSPSRKAAKRPTRWPRCARSSARAIRRWRFATSSAARSRRNPTAAFICTPARKSASPRRRRSRRNASCWRCWPCISAGCGI